MEIHKQEFEKAIEHLRSELTKLRTGRVSPAIIEDVKVDYYGAPTPVSQLGNITVPEARQLLVIPWDKNSLQQIEKAIREAGMGLNPSNEGDKIRINIPPLNEERRRELAKLSGKLAEEARVRVRNLREEELKRIKAEEAEGKIREDERFRRQEELQRIVEEHNGKIKELADGKEKEIMTV